VRRRLLEEIDVLWRTAQLRSTQVQPLEEVRAALAVFDGTLLEVVPEIYRELDNVLGPDDAGRRPPLAPAFLRFGTWVGGDRDGNPFVTAEVTALTMRIQFEQVLSALEAAVARAGRMLTVDHETTPPSPGPRGPVGPGWGGSKRAPGRDRRSLCRRAAPRVPALHRGAPRGHPAGCAGGSLRVLRRAPRRPARSPAIPGRRGRCAACVWRAAEGDLAGANVRLPPGRAGDPAAQPGARAGAERGSCGRPTLGRYRGGPRDAPGDGGHPAPLWCGRLPALRDQLHPGCG